MIIEDRELDRALIQVVKDLRICYDCSYLAAIKLLVELLETVSNEELYEQIIDIGRGL